MRYCIFCGVQVSDGVRGSTRLSDTLTHWFGRRGTRMVIPVAESAMPDEEEHMVFAHAFTPITQHMDNGKVVEQGPWVCIADTADHAFGEKWERVNAQVGRRIS